MANSNDTQETEKLSEIIVENNEIISDINQLVKKIKDQKEIADENICNDYIKQFQELQIDLDDIIEVIENCRQENDPNLKSFDKEKKSAKSKALDSKKIIKENLTKLENVLSRLKQNSKKEEVKDKDSKTSEMDDKKVNNTEVKPLERTASKEKNLNTSENSDSKKKEKSKKEEKSDSKKSKGKKKKKDEKSEKTEKDVENNEENNDKSKDDKDTQSTKSSDRDSFRKKGILKKSKSKGKEDSKEVSKDSSKQVTEDEILEDIVSSQEDLNSESSPLRSYGQSKTIPELLDSDDDAKSQMSLSRENISGKENKIHKLPELEDAGRDLQIDDSEKKGSKKSKKSKNKEKDKKSENEDKKGEKEDKKSEKEDKKGEKEDKTGEKEDKKSRKKDKKSEKDDKKGELDGKKDVKEDKKDEKKDKKSEEDETNEDKKSEKEDKKTEKDEKKGDKEDKKKQKNKKDKKSTDKQKVDPKENEKLNSSANNSSENKTSKIKDEEIPVLQENVSNQYSSPAEANKRSGSEKQHQQQQKKTSNNIKENEDTHGNDSGEAYLVTKGFPAEQEEDLSCVSGEVISILEITDDDWWYAKNAKGKVGYVPKAFIKKKEPKSTDIESPVDPVILTSREEHAISDDDQNKEENVLWNQIKQSRHDKHISELLMAMGNMPSGVRYSTLHGWSQENLYKSKFVANFCPKLSDSHLSFSELRNQIRPQQVKIQRQIQLNKVIQFPLLSNKFIIKSRHVRMCLFDGEKAISNIHVMRATVNEKDLKTWLFNSKVNDTVPSIDHNDVFLRFNQSSTNMSILMEFCVLGFKSKLNTATSASDAKIEEEFSDEELIEFSIGWINIPLYESNGQPISTKKGDFQLNGGTPFEQGLEVEASESTSETGNKLKFTGSQNKQPMVSIRIYIPNKENKDLLETLPSMIIGSSLNVTILSFYRRILAEKVLDHRNDLTSTKPIYSPFLVSFIEAAKYPDIMDMLRVIWNEKLKVMKSADKKDYSKMNDYFEKVFMEYIHPLTKLTNLPDMNLARKSIQQNRSSIIHGFVQRAKEDYVSVLLTDEFSYAPFAFDEVNFSLTPIYMRAE